ncbi:MAG: signal peptidase II [Lachnospiraceae bacterium]|nr:signal peptidase II [Lachnospiraceae bacterium]
MKDKNITLIWAIRLLAFGVLVLVDQLTKYLVRLHMSDYKPIPLIKDVFELQYLENRGAAFGVLQNKIPVFLVVTVIVLCAVIWLMAKIPAKKKYFFLDASLLLIVSGAVGNMIDRVYFGFVTDFFYFKLIDFPVFNVADCYVTVSAVLLIILVVFVYQDEDFLFLKKKGN